MQHREIKRKPRRNLMEFVGIAPNLLGGMDAQEYVTRMRRGEFPDLELANQQYNTEFEVVRYTVLNQINAPDS